MKHNGKLLGGDFSVKMKHLGANYGSNRLIFAPHVEFGDLLTLLLDRMRYL